MAPGEDVPPQEMHVHFSGPFSMEERGDGACVFTHEMGAKSGVYIWTIEVQGEHWLWYVGQTRGPFRDRLAEHVQNMLSGWWDVYDADGLARGENRIVHETARGWPGTLGAYLHNFEEASPNVLRALRLSRLHLTELPPDPSILSCVEGAIGRLYADHPDNPRFSSFVEGNRVPIRDLTAPPIRLSITSDVPIAGLHTEIDA